MNVENTIRGLLATFGICLPKHLKTYDQRVRKALEGQPDLLRIIGDPTRVERLSFRSWLFETPGARERRPSR
jgi:hypothetical protein